MAAHLQQLQAGRICEPQAILAALAEGRLGSSANAMRQPARIALCFANLGRTMLHIFDHICRILLAEGHATDWGDCVAASVTDQTVDELNQELAEYRRLECNEVIGELSAVGRVLSQTMHRFNTQNRYNIFESVLNLHTGSHRALGRGDGWISRAGETIYLRHAIAELAGLETERWQPTFRLNSATQFLTELGRLP